MCVWRVQRSPPASSPDNLPWWLEVRCVSSNRSSLCPLDCTISQQHLHFAFCHQRANQFHSVDTCRIPLWTCWEYSLFDTLTSPLVAATFWLADCQSKHLVQQTAHLIIEAGWERVEFTQKFVLGYHVNQILLWLCHVVAVVALACVLFFLFLFLLDDAAVVLGSLPWPSNSS